MPNNEPNVDVFLEFINLHKSSESWDIPFR
jgi:hypothetical protein